jgi:hypothetical protein
MPRGFQVTFAGSVAKDPAYLSSNEDAYCINTAESRLALSDGASESFDSQSWARMLVESYSASSAFSVDWLRATVSTFSSLYVREDLSWSKQGAFDKGSFATLLGVELINSTDSIELIGIGDSICALVVDSRFVKSFPYSRSIEFKQRPELCSTKDSLNQFAGVSDFFFSHTVSWALDGLACPQLLCMTDALGEWFLKSIEADTVDWTSLLNMSTKEEFEDLVRQLKSEHAMRIDDATLIRVAL